MRNRFWAELGLICLPALLALGLLVFTAPPATRAHDGTLTVNSALDDPDATPGNCICATAGGSCTLRAAIQEANACPDGQSILFSQPWAIVPVTALPAVTGNGTVIDGGEWWMVGSGLGLPGVLLDGAGGAFNGLHITASDCAVYGLEIIRFGGHGVLLSGGAKRNILGGTGTHQRNVISRNGANGVMIQADATVDNEVIGNYVGTTPEGEAVEWGGLSDWGNGHHGISLWTGGGNIVRDNLVADNSWSGVTADQVPDGLISHNRIGMDIHGAPLGNAFYGIHIGNGAAVEVAENQIAYNERGVHVEGGSSPEIHHNNIYGNNAMLLGLPDGGGILVTGTATEAWVHDNDITDNTARYGGGVAVQAAASATLHGNKILDNQTEIGGGISMGGGGVYVYQAAATIEGNRIADNQVTDSASLQVYGGGVFLNDVTTVDLIGNEIADNQVQGRNGGGGGIAMIQGGDVRIEHNKVMGNSRDTITHGGSAIDIDNDPARSNVGIDWNWIADNTGGNAAVAILTAGRVWLRNNVIAGNEGNGLLLLYATDNLWANNNTLADNSGSGVSLLNSTLDLRNTILAFNAGYGLYMQESTVIQDYNAAWGNGDGPSNSAVIFLVEADPLFFGGDNDPYALRPGSPCLDAGTGCGGISYNGLLRPQGSGYDIGAYEMAPAVHLPLVLRTAGP